MRLLTLAIFLALVSATATAQTPGQNTFDIGSPSVTELYVDPVSGSDSRTGTSPAQAFRSLNAAWNAIPDGNLSSGYRINILPGTIPESDIPNYWESKRGTSAAPIIIRALNGRNTVVLNGDINMYDCRYVYFLDFTIRPEPAGDTFHCEQCQYVLLRGMTFNGGNRVAWETVKFNQSKNIFIEECDISGAEDNALDFVAVQYGHVVRSKIHNASDWCVYAKGGSADILYEGNEIYNCGTGGLTAGQGSGFEFMVSPWIHYEAYNIKGVNNIIYDIEGAGLGVNGGYNVLMAYNTLYRVGQRSHLIEVVFGLRSCDGNPTACSDRAAAGGWGPSAVTSEGHPIGNRNVIIANNVIVNPPGTQSQYQHFQILDRRNPPGGSSAPSPAITDENLSIRGNIIFNGPSNHPLGVEGNSDACVSGGCSAAQLLAENSINQFEPAFRNAAGGDFRPAPGSALAAAISATFSDFPGGDLPPAPTVPQGNLQNAVPTDRGGASRASALVPGAYAGPNSDVNPTPGTPTTGGPTDTTAPRISAVRATPASIRKGTSVTISATVTDASGVSTVSGTLGRQTVTLRRARQGNTYSRKFKVTQTGRLNVRITATDIYGNSASRNGSRVQVRR